MFKDIFGELLQTRGITAYKVAKDTGISQGVMNEYARGIKTPASKNLKKIADYFNVSVDYLLGHDEPQEPEDVMADVRFAFTKLSGDPTEITEEDLEDVRKYVIYIKEKRKKERNGNKS